MFFDHDQEVKYTLENNRQCHNSILQCNMILYRVINYPNTGSTIVLQVSYTGMTIDN